MGANPTNPRFDAPAPCLSRLGDMGILKFESEILSQIVQLKDEGPLQPRGD